MKKLLKTLILSMLVLAMSLSMVACNKNGEEAEVTPVKKVSFDDGVHEFNQTETGKYIVKDGVSDYKLVINNSTYSLYSEAKADFNLLFKRATGITLEVVYDSSVNWTEDAKYISLGKTKLVEQAGISPDEYSVEKIGEEGVRILTEGNTVFLLGNTYGVSYSVYVLFEMMFNFEYYQRECFYIDENVSNVPLMDYDVTDLPDVKFGEVSPKIDRTGVNAIPNQIDSLYYGSTATEEVSLMGNRSRNAHYGYYELTCLAYPNPQATSGSDIHNILTSYLPAGGTGIESKWYSDSGTQACFTAHGDPESLERFVDHCVEVIKDSVARYPTEKYPHKKYISITCSDGSTATCMCEHCSKIANANNGASISASIIFLNKVTEKVNAWMEENKDADFYRSDFQVYMFAYAASADAPCYYDAETGVATPCNDYVVCQKGSAIFYVDGGGWYPTYHEEKAYNRERMAGWKALTPDSDLLVWHNAGNTAGATFYDPLGSYGSDYWEFYAAHDIDLLYLGNDHTDQSATSFMDLSYYVCKKLRWNCKLNLNDLVDEYMTANYGNAADIMWGLYNSLKLHWYTVMDRLEADPNSKVHNSYIYTKANWPYQLNIYWYNECEKAIDAVSDVKLVDPELYEMIVYRIKKEEIAPLYNIINLHASSTPRELNDEQIAMYKSKLYDIVKNYPYMKPSVGLQPIINYVQ